MKEETTHREIPDQNITDEMTMEELKQYLDSPAKIGDIVKLAGAMAKDLVYSEMQDLFEYATSMSFHIEAIKEILFENDLIDKEGFVDIVQRHMDEANDLFQERLKALQEEENQSAEEEPKVQPKPKADVRYVLDVDSDLDVEISKRAEE